MPIHAKKQEGEGVQIGDYIEFEPVEFDAVIDGRRLPANPITSPVPALAEKGKELAILSGRAIGWAGVAIFWICCALVYTIGAIVKRIAIGARDALQSHPEDTPVQGPDRKKPDIEVTVNVKIR